LVHFHAAACGITGGLREEAQDGGRVVCEILVGGAQQRGYDGLARNGLAGGSACPTLVVEDFLAEVSSAPALLLFVFGVAPAD